MRQSPESGQPRTERRAARREQRKAEKRQGQLSMNRRKLFKWGLLGASTLGAITFGVHESRRGKARQGEDHELGSQTRTFEERLIEYSKLSERLGPVYERVKQRMAWLAAQLEQRKHLMEPGLYEYLRAPLEQFEFNLENADWNYYAVARRELEAAGPNGAEVSSFENADIRNFMYALERDEHFVATYDPLQRQLAISEHYEAESVVDGLVTYHELTHTLQDTSMRLRLETEEQADAYYGFHNPKAGTESRINIAFEYDAYERQLLVLNVITDGKLASDVQRGTLFIEQYEQQLGVTTPEDQQTFMFLMRLAKPFFAEGTPTPITKQVVRKLVREYYGQGRTVYEWETLEELQEVWGEQ